ncbi:MAG: hypothetical protein H7A46_18660 [Verrucomicrobiales bacterium]|nr:hypothetical protein [Verrucomicrobiales bacterium]
MQIRIEKLVVRRDARGWVYEPLNGNALAGFRNVHLVWTEPGAVRGNHYHERGTEVVAVSGPTLVRFREAGGLRDHLVPPGEVWQFTIPPGIPHALKNVGDRPVLMVGLNTEFLNRDAPDVHREVLIDPATNA